MSDGRRPARLAALQSGSFRALSGSGFFVDGAQAMLYATVAWQVYQVSGSATALGLLGIVRFLPSVALSMVSGAAADSYDRQKLLLAARGLLLIAGPGCCSSPPAAAIDWRRSTCW